MTARQRPEIRERRLLSRLASGSARIRTDLPLALLDGVAAVAAHTVILLVRFEGAVPPRFSSDFRVFLPAAVATHLLANWAWGLYGEMWRHASVQEARRVVLSGMSAGALLLALFYGPRTAPLSVILLGGLTTTMLVGAIRFQSRLFAFRRTAQTRDARRVVVLGAGETGAVIVRDMLRQADLGLRPVAVLDDDPRKQGRALHGVPIVGGLDRVADTVRVFHAEEALLAIPSADGELVRSAAALADEAGLTLKVLPTVGELINGEVGLRDVRDLTIDDLLGRAQVRTDLEAVRSILTGRRVLITGAGGSIGSEIARQVAACDPAVLLLLDHDETHLYDTAADLRGDHHVQVLADIRDRGVVHAVMARHRPEVVFHAAAHKHVPLLEDHPCEAVRTNVLGTMNVVDAAVACGVERFVFISTDKAVRPSSVMGASKRLAEQVVLGRGGPGRYCAVRFGNVLGSRGSVVPRFMRQIEQGGPVTVTDARMTRFFMTIPEAVQLVLQAAVFATGGEVFMLDMGEPVRILDLAQRMIRLSGRRVGTDVPIRITGIRPGEKLHEELFVPEDESPHPSPHPAIVVLHPAVPRGHALDETLRRLRDAAVSRDEDAAACLVHEFAAGPRRAQPAAAADARTVVVIDQEDASWRPSNA